MRGQGCYRARGAEGRAEGRAACAPARGPARPSSLARGSRGSARGADLGGRRLRASLGEGITESGVRDEQGAVADLSTSPPSEAGVAAGAEKTVGVLLLNLGGPETLDDVRPFLYNLFADPDILRLPGAASIFQPFIAEVISTLRAPMSRKGYEAIGGGSPLRRTTEEQAARLEEAMERMGVSAKTYVAMRYWHPFTEEAISRVKADGVTDLVVLPLYPQFSVSTSGSSLRLLEEIFQTDPGLKQLRHTVIPSWYQRAGYIRAMTDLVEADLKKKQNWGPTKQEDVHIFFSAHGVPKSYVDEAGDPYKEEMEETVGLIMAELAGRGYGNGHTLAYQSRVGPVEWLEPYTEDSIKFLAKQGVEALLVIPISFVSEHIETLEEIDMEYRELAEEEGIKHWARCPALGTNALFMDDLASAVVEALPYCSGVVSAQAEEEGEAFPGLTKGLVPMGKVDQLLETYDNDRRVLPFPPEGAMVGWKWGWTRSAELWNGRLAMITIAALLLWELNTGLPFVSPAVWLMVGAGGNTAV